MRYFFDDYALDTERRELRRGAHVVPTTPQVFDLLDFRDGSPPGLNLAWWFWLSLLYASAPIG